MSKTRPAEPTAERFEDHLKRLEQLVEQLEQGELDLDTAVGTYEAGVQAWRRCHELLSQAEKKIEMLAQQAGGEQTIVPFDADGPAEA